MTARLVMAAAVTLLAGPALAGGWDSADPKIQAWFREAPVVACCGDGDAYEADFFESNKDGVVATITDDGKNLCRDSYDEEGNKSSTCKVSVAPGTKIKVPAKDLRAEPRNPTGHGVIFLRQGDLGAICYWLPGGG